MSAKVIPCVLLFSFYGLGSGRHFNGDWPEYGGTVDAQRYSIRARIDSSNVSQLRVAWVFHTHVFDIQSPASNARASFEATPILWNGALYFDTPFNVVFAIDAASGKKRWVYDPKVDRERGIYIVTSRGVALWHSKTPSQETCGSDRVFVATLDRRLISRDARTGLPCAGFGEGGVVDLSKGVDIARLDMYSFTSPPTIVGNTVILGSSIGDNQQTYVASGAVRGFSAITGKQIWSWEPLRQPNRQRKYGSANAWSVMSADPVRDLIFVPTGSASLDFFGGLRKGDNHDANSIVALRASTGVRVWGFQVVHHDIWDYDIASEPLLFTFRGKIPAVAITTKTNMIYVFNRVTGEPLYPIEERPVPKTTLMGEESWPTQPFSSLPPLSPLSYSASQLHFSSVEDQKFCRDKLSSLDYKGLFTPPSQHGALIYPGSLGGSNWGSSAFNPQTSVLYTRVSNFPFIVRETPRREMSFPNSQFLRRLQHKYLRLVPERLGGDPAPFDSIYPSPDGGGDQREDSPQTGSPFTLLRSGLISPNGLPCAPEPFGSIVATNLDTGIQLWSVPHGTMNKGGSGSIGAGGPIATAGGLVFAASTNDPFLRAYDSTNGRELVRLQLPVPANATPMTYEVDGKQYVVIAAGGHGFIGKGQSDQVIAFALPDSGVATRQAVRSRRHGD